MKATILIAGPVPKTLSGEVIACGEMATKKKADWWVYVDAEDEGLEVKGDPKVCCHGALGKECAGSLSLRPTPNSWDNAANLALALAAYLRADELKVIGLNSMEEEEQVAFRLEAKRLWPGKSILI